MKHPKSIVHPLALSLTAALVVPVLFHPAVPASAAMRNVPASAATRNAPAPHWLVVAAGRHAVTLTIIAGYTKVLGGFNFNGYGKGTMVVSVPSGYRVNVVFSNKGAYPHSVVFTPYNLKGKMDGYPLAFRGSTSPHNQDGIGAGHPAERFSFIADKVGTYAIVCGVPGHENAGMWDEFKVTRGGKPSIKML